MKITKIKIFATFIIQAMKIIPIVYKYGKFLYDDIKKMYSEDEIKKLDDTIIKALEVENE